MIRPRQVFSQVCAGLVAIALFGSIKSTAHTQTLLVQSFDSDTINVYCSSNQDLTGDCFNSDDNSILDCALVPGKIISCLDSQNKLFSCINFGSNQTGQGYFQCAPKIESDQT